MSRFSRSVICFTISRDRLARVFEKFHLIEDDGAQIHGSGATVSLPPSGKIGFYICYFEAGLRAPPSSFFGQVIKTYKIRTCQLKPNFFSKLICFELSCQTSLVVLMVDLFRHFFRIYDCGAWFYFRPKERVS